jgi:hypothetical protein
MFAILVLEDSGLTVTTKLPDSNQAALMLPFTAPTGYGMGKSGWVTSQFKPGDDVPVALLTKWIDESYRAVAPKKLVAQLDGGAGAPKAEKAAPAKAKAKAAPKSKTAPAAAKKTATKKAATRKTAAKKTPATTRARRA